MMGTEDAALAWPVHTLDGIPDDIPKNREPVAGRAA